MMEPRPRQMKVLLTRSREGNSSLERRVREMGMTPVAFDALTFAPPSSWRGIDSALRRLREFDWVVFTSATGVKFVMERARKLGVNFGGVRLAAVGRGTAAALRRYGEEPDFMPSEFTTERLGMELPRTGKRVLLLRADIAGGRLVKTLEERGFEVSQLRAYRTLRAGSEVSGDLLDADVVAFASPSAVRSLCMSLGRERLSVLKKRAVAACIGPVTAEAARRAGFRLLPVPADHTVDSLLEAIKGAYPG